MTESFWHKLIGFEHLHWIAVIVVLLYAWWTLRILSRHPKRLIYPALLVFLAATGLYWMAYDSTGISSLYASLSMGAFSALDLFVFKIVTNHLVILVALFMCAAWTTSILIVNQLASKFFSRIRVRFLSKKENTHIFLGVNQEALALMEDLAKDPKNSIIAVLFPSEEKVPATVSFYQILRGINTGQFRQVRDIAPQAVVLHARKPLGQGKEEDV